MPNQVVYDAMEWIAKTRHVIPEFDKILHAAGCALAYGAGRIGGNLTSRVTNLKLNPYITGALTALGVQTAWEIYIDPRLPFTAPSFMNSVGDYLGCFAGIVLAAGGDYVIKKRREKLEKLASDEKTYTFSELRRRGFNWPRL